MSASWSHRASLHRVRAGIGLAVVMVACSANDSPTAEESRAAVLDTIETPTPETQPDRETQTDRAGGPSTTAAIASAPVTTLVGDVEITGVRRLPRLELRWVDVELDLPEGENVGAGFRFVGFVDGEMTAVGVSSTTPGMQTLATWRSTDGESWARTDQPIGSDASIHSVMAVGDRLVATGSRDDRDGIELLVWGTDTDGAWQPVDLGPDIDSNDLTSWYQATNGQGIVMVAERIGVDGFPGPPLTIETDRHRLVLDEFDGTYELIDRATDVVVVSGSTSEIYLWRDDGQAVWDVDAGELLTVVPWEVWNDAWPTGSPLPIPVPTDPVAASPTIDWDGYRVVLDEATDRVEVVEVTTGEVVVRASHEEFFRGPSPRFRDDTSGEVVWSPTWAEWDTLMQSAHDSNDRPVGAEPPRSLIVSPDGDVWTEIELDAAGDSHVESLWSVAGEYHLVVVDHGAGEPTRHLHRSHDGIDWTTTETDVDRPMTVPPVSGPGGAIAVSIPTTGSDFPRLTTSPDGATWTPVFQLGEQGDGRHAWFDLLASGTGGRAAIATLAPQGPPEALTITIDDRTARFGDAEQAFTITDGNGDVLLAADWQTLEMALDGDLEPIVTYDDGITTFWGTGGSIMMQIPDETITTAYELRHQAHLADTDRVLFLERDGTWYEVQVPLEGETYAQALAVGDQAVLVGVGHWGEPGLECCEGDMEFGMTTLRILVGHLDDAAR